MNYSTHTPPLSYNAREVQQELRIDHEQFQSGQVDQLTTDKSKQLQEYHQSRLERYAEQKYGWTMEPQKRISKAARELIKLQQSGINVARHISEVIGENHEDYMMKLLQLHEKCFLIR